MLLLKSFQPRDQNDFFYFFSLIAATTYLLTFLSKLITKREPVAYWDCWVYLTLNAIYWIILAIRYY